MDAHEPTPFASRQHQPTPSAAARAKDDRLQDLESVFVALACVLAAGLLYCCIAVARMLNEHSNERRKDYAGIALAEAFSAEDGDAGELEAEEEPPEREAGQLQSSKKVSSHKA